MENFYFPCRTAELSKKAIYWKLSSVNRASWGRGSEYLTSCGEVSKKISRLEIRRNRLHKPSFIYCLSALRQTHKKGMMATTLFILQTCCDNRGRPC